MDGDIRYEAIRARVAEVHGAAAHERLARAADAMAGRPSPEARPRASVVTAILAVARRVSRPLWA